jgi:hypothetical protein
MEQNPFDNKNQNTAFDRLISFINDTNEFAACYLTGSYAQGYAVSPDVSDIDFTLISCQNLPRETKEKLDILIEETKAELGVDLDISVIEQSSDAPSNEDHVKFSYLGIAFREAAMSAKLSGKLIWGEDILASLPLPSPEEYLKATAEIPFEFSNRIRGYNGLDYPLTYPNEADEFLGYLRFDEDTGDLSTKPLISLLTWLGTATAAQLSPEKMIGNKDQCVKTLSQLAPQKGGELSYIFDKCRREWGYKVPQTQQDKQKLREICMKALEWENEYRNQFFPHMKAYNT